MCVFLSVLILNRISCELRSSRPGHRARKSCGYGSCEKWEADGWSGRKEGRGGTQHPLKWATSEEETKME